MALTRLSLEHELEKLFCWKCRDLMIHFLQPVLFALAPPTFLYLTDVYKWDLS